MIFNYAMIASLIPTHNRLRYPERIQSFIDLIIRNTNFKSKIVLYKLNDKIYVHDGHHRLCAWMSILALYASWASIPKEDIIMQDVDLEWFTIKNRESGWLTPFNPTTHCRTPDFFQHKSILLENYDRLEEFNHLFLEERRVFSLEEFYDRNVSDYYVGYSCGKVAG